MSYINIRPTDRFVSVCVPEREDVYGMLLMTVGKGWCVVAEHLSSTEGWSERDIGRKRIELGIPDVQYEWRGLMTHDEIKAHYPPATEEEMAADEKLRGIVNSDRILRDITTIRTAMEDPEVDLRNWDAETLDAFKLVENYLNRMVGNENVRKVLNGLRGYELDDEDLGKLFVEDICPHVGDWWKIKTPMFEKAIVVEVYSVTMRNSAVNPVMITFGQRGLQEDDRSLKQMPVDLFLEASRKVSTATERRLDARGMSTDYPSQSDEELAAAAERSRIWRMTEQQVIEHCTDLGHSLVPDHGLGMSGWSIWRMSCWSCGGRAVINAGQGYYGSATTDPCERSR